MQLHHLAAGKTLAQLRNDFQNTDVAHFGYQSDNLRQHVIANQYRHFVGPFGMNGCSAATGIRTVHHIIVNETGGMQQFQRHGRTQRLVRHAVA